MISVRTSFLHLFITLGLCIQRVPIHSQSSFKIMNIYIWLESFKNLWSMLNLCSHLMNIDNLVQVCISLVYYHTICAILSIGFPAVLKQVLIVPWFISHSNMKIHVWVLRRRQSWYTLEFMEYSWTDEPSNT